MAKSSMICPFSRGPCVECAIYRGRHYFLCFAREYRGFIEGTREEPAEAKASVFEELDAIVDALDRGSVRLDGTVTSGKRVTIRSNLRLRKGLERPDIVLNDRADLGGLLRTLCGFIDSSLFNEREGLIDQPVLVTLNGTPYASLEKNLDTPLADGDVVEINLASVVGG